MNRLDLARRPLLIWCRQLALACRRHALALLAWLFMACWPGLASAAPGPAQALRELQASGDTVVARYRDGQASGEQTAAAFSQLYFNVFEGAGLELSLGGQDRALMLSIEQGFARAIQVALEQQPPQALDTTWQALRGDLARATPLMADTEAQGRWAAFVQSLLIVLREGVEALLVVTALAAFLRRSGQADRLPWLWFGVGAGVVASATLAWGLQGVLDAAGAWRGGLQGVMVVVAALMMAQVSAWMYARRSAERWNQTLKAQLAGAADGTPWMTALVSAVAVFREGVETLLFFQALAGASVGQWGGLLGGAALGAVLLVLLFLAMQHWGVRLPFTLFFTVTAALLLVLALVFMGKGVFALQMAGWVPRLEVHGMGTGWGWLGVYPSSQTLGAQLALLAGVLLACGAATRERRR